MFRVFKRPWWKDNPSWPNGLEPDGAGNGKTIDYVDTEEEARAMCKQFNNGPRTPHELKYSIKYEYEEKRRKG